MSFRVFHRPILHLNYRREKAYRIGILMGLAENDPEGQERFATFRNGLQTLGWTDGGNIHLITRWAGGDIARTRAYATELVGFAPDAILVNSPSGLTALKIATKSIPVVFVQVATEAAGSDINPARPAGNITGFYTFYEYSMAGKWLRQSWPSVLLDESRNGPAPERFEH